MSGSKFLHVDTVNILFAVTLHSSDFIFPFEIENPLSRGNYQICYYLIFVGHVVWKLLNRPSVQFLYSQLNPVAGRVNQFRLARNGKKEKMCEEKSNNMKTKTIEEWRKKKRGKITRAFVAVLVNWVVNKVCRCKWIKLFPMCLNYITYIVVSKYFLFTARQSYYFTIYNYIKYISKFLFLLHFSPIQSESTGC